MRAAKPLFEVFRGTKTEIRAHVDDQTLKTIFAQRLDFRRARSVTSAGDYNVQALFCGDGCEGA